MDYHAMDADAVLQEKKSNKDGLTNEEAKKRLDELGPNKITETKTVKWYKVLFRQFKDPLIFLLIGAGLVSFFVNTEKPQESIAIGVIICINVLIGFFQEFRAERAMEALSKLAPAQTVVMRNGKELKIESRDVVPGDIIVLEAGDTIPADARIIKADGLVTIEAALTGESGSVRKTADSAKQDTPLAERDCMLYSGTSISEGHVVAVVVETGDATEFGKIAQSLGEVEQKQTPLQRKFTTLAKQISVIAIILITIVFIMGYLKWEDSFGTILLFALVLAVGTVPSALPLIVTFSLSVGAKSLAKVNLLLRSLPAAESMGATSFICTDKTGTLTRNEMTAVKIYLGESVDVPGRGYEATEKVSVPGREKDLAMLAQISLTCNDAAVNDGQVIGDPTEAALVVLARKAGLDEVGERANEYPFDSERKRMSVTADGKTFVKGAPESVLEACTKIQEKGKVRKLTPKDKETILKVQEEYAENALRVLALAYKKGEAKNVEEAEKDLIFVGLTGLQDPARDGVKEAVQECHEAGIKVMMITGDHIITARAIATELGILTGKLCVENKEVEAWSDEELAAKVENIEVIARATPQLKMRIINSLQNKRHIVAMTGDGVNDAPALKKADIGLAMGITGTDVAKQSSKGILLDDKFTTIVSAVKEGRNIFDKIIKSAKYLLSCNFGEIVTVMGALLVHNVLPLQPLQILMINMLTDTAPAAGLSMERVEDDVMQREPRKLDDPPLDRQKLLMIASFGLIMGAITVVIFGRHLSQGLPTAQTVAFTSLVIMQLFAVTSMRSFRPLDINLFKNIPLLLGICFSVCLQILAVYLPFLQSLLGTVPLNAAHWGSILLAGGISYVIFESAKAIVKKVTGARG